MKTCLAYLGFALFLMFITFHVLMGKLPSTFFQDVYEVVKLVPHGRVTTYGAIAAYLGLKSSARMVGWAMNQTPKGEGIPAHRVVNRQGLLTGKAFFGVPDEMQKRLEAEGIVVKEDQVQHFKEVLWEPMKELEL